MVDIHFQHLHLLLNHIPVIGTMAGAALLLISFMVNTADVRKSSLIVLLVAAVATVPAFISGVGAQVDLLAGNPDVSAELIQRHLGAAELAIWFIFATGILATAALWRWHRVGPPTGAMAAALVVMSLLSVALVARTGNTGGEIRHEEVRYEQPSMVEGIIAAFEPSPPVFTNLMIANKWWWAFIIGLHFLGLTLLLGTVGLLHLRVLGLAKLLPIAPLNQLVPWGLVGIALNIVTGMLAYIGMTSYYTFNIAFVAKIAALLLGMATIALFYSTSLFGDCAKVEAGQDAPLRAKVFAAASLVLWFGVIFLGRYIQPFENSIPR